MSGVKSMTVFFSSILLAALVLLSPSDAWAGCETDADCKGARVCADGECVSGCDKDSDCPGDQICEARACVSSGQAPAPAPAPPPPAPEPAAAPAPAQPPPGYAQPQQPPPNYNYNYGLPPGAQPAPAQGGMKRRSKGLMITGIIMLGVGGVALIAGAVVAVTALEADCSYDIYSGSYCHEDEDMLAAGGIMMGVGGAMVIAGIIMTPIGASKVPVQSAELGIDGIEIEPVLALDNSGLRVRF